MRSIRSRLHRRLIVSLGAAWIFSFFLAVGVGHMEYREAFESRLAHTAQLMLTFAAAQEDIAFASPGAGFLDAFDDTDDYIVVLSRGDRLLYSSIALPEAAELVAAGEGAPGKLYSRIAAAAGTTWALTNYLDAESGTRVTLGVDVYEPLHSTLEVAGISVLVFCITSGVAGILIFYGVRGGLGPLNFFAAQVGERGRHNLTPISPTTTPDELRPVADALNGLMARLDSALRRERDFVGNAAHELRTPLAAIRAQLEAIEPEELPPAAAERFDHILRATDRAGHMISQLLDLSRSQSLGTAGTPGREADLTELAETVIADLAPAALGRNVEIALEAPPRCRVATDPDLLAMLLRNLIENAGKYCGTPGRVEVRIEKSPEQVIRISDNGPGLSGVAFEEAAAKFERLGRTDGYGAGLGLSIVHEIARHLGIAVRAEERGPLGGLSVILRLPQKISSPPLRTGI